MRRLILAVAALLLAPPAVLRAAEKPWPNILWISCEDTSPWLGSRGEPCASTPNLDRLARTGAQYKNAFVNPCPPGPRPLAHAQSGNKGSVTLTE